METPQQEAKKRILATINELEAANRKALLKEVGDELDTPLEGAAPTGEAANEKFHKRYVFTIGLLLLVTFFLAWLKGGNGLFGDQDDPRTLFMFLGFVVALASYLASVARETVKKLGALDKEKKEERLKLKRYIAWTVTAEMQLVLLGLLTIARVAAGPDPFIPSPFSQPILLDNILLIYLCSILVLLSFLHVRVWVIEHPFRH